MKVREPLFPHPNRQSHCPHLAQPHMIMELEKHGAQSWLCIAGWSNAAAVLGCTR